MRPARVLGTFELPRHHESLSCFEAVSPSRARSGRPASRRLAARLFQFQVGLGEAGRPGFRRLGRFGLAGRASWDAGAVSLSGFPLLRNHAKARGRCWRGRSDKEQSASGCAGRERVWQNGWFHSLLWRMNNNLARSSRVLKRSPRALKRRSLHGFCITLSHGWLRCSHSDWEL